jgi:Mcm10 replication factor
MMQDRLTQLEQQEKMAEVLEQHTKEELWVYKCRECRITREFIPDACRTRHHVLTRVRMVKRFFKCDGCKKRTQYVY